MKIVYWSQSGNTQEMAEAIAEGVRAAGAEAEVLDMENVQPADLADESAFAIGCPAMGDEVLEETCAEPFFTELESAISGKKVGLFGSYGWGDGQWMRDWEERTKNAGAELVGDAGVICCDSPDEEAKEACRKLGEQLCG